MDHSFVVVEPDPVVRMDLVGTLEHRFPAAIVAAFSSVDEMGQIMDHLAVSACVFVSGALVPDLAPDLARLVVETGGRVVSIGAPRSDAVLTTVLEMPFTMTTILDALSSGAPDQPAPLPEAHT